MKMHEIVTANEVPDSSILYESIAPYLNSLYIYYKDMYCCEPVLMVTDVFNAAQYVKIVSENEFLEAIENYFGEPINFDNEESDSFANYEVICSNSMVLKELL